MGVARKWKILLSYVYTKHNETSYIGLFGANKIGNNINAVTPVATAEAYPIVLTCSLLNNADSCLTNGPVAGLGADILRISWSE